MEDEVGDVLEKGMARARLGLEQLATKSSIAVPRLRDALDYRSELTSEELGRAAAVLGLNEVGLCALAAGNATSVYGDSPRVARASGNTS